MTQTDEQLMARYVGGDTDAFGELYARYAPRLNGMFRRGVNDSQAVADLVQQTFLQLHRARLDFKLDSKLRPWLFSIALNLKRRYFRDTSKKRMASLELDPGIDATASGEARRIETADLLRVALGQLNQGQREVIELHWFQGLSFAEVAKHVGASVSAVKVRAHRGYKRLRDLLDSV
jgi:RNA polymerase sigma factor (sigma-70 family)